MNNSLKGKKILIFQQRGWGTGVGHFLAKKLQIEGCGLAALTIKRSTHEFIINQKKVRYDLIVNADSILSRPQDYLTQEDRNLPISQICEDLGVDSIWPLVSIDRSYVKSYKDKFYYAFRQNVPDEIIIDTVKVIYKYIIKEIFEKFNPEIILSPGIVSLIHIMMYYYAKKRGVKMMGITDCKIDRMFIFSYDFNDDEGPFFKRVDALNNNLTQSDNLTKAKEYIQNFRQTYQKPIDIVLKEEKEKNKKSLKQIIRHHLSPFYHILRWYLKKPINFLETTGISIDYKPPKIILRDHYCHDRYIRFMKNFKYFPFEKLTKFVYFPLQLQPEFTIDVVAPYFSNQIEIARLVAMSLPDDYTLVTKEHPAMIGLRPPSYIEKICKIPNVKFIDYRTPSEEVIKKADLVISPGGTTIVEAAFYRKPAIQLGNLGATLKLPNNFKHTDMTTLTDKIKKVLATNLDTTEYERRLENFVAAAYDTGFKVDYYKIWDGTDSSDAEKLWLAYKKELGCVLSPQHYYNS